MDHIQDPNPDSSIFRTYVLLNPLTLCRTTLLLRYEAARNATVLSHSFTPLTLPAFCSILPRISMRENYYSLATSTMTELTSRSLSAKLLELYHLPGPVNDQESLRDAKILKIVQMEFQKRTQIVPSFCSSDKISRIILADTCFSLLSSKAYRHHSPTPSPPGSPVEELNSTQLQNGKLSSSYLEL